MKVITFNSGGMRQSDKLGFFEWAARENPDVICLQETRVAAGIPKGAELKDYLCILNSAKKKGYSGTATYLKISENIKRISLGLSDIDGDHWLPFDLEGRVIYVEYNHAIIINVSVPSGDSGSERQIFKMDFLNRFLEFLIKLKGEKSVPILVCGTFNISNTTQDIRNWKGSQKSSGFLRSEREWLSALISVGYGDVFRGMNPSIDGYTMWKNDISKKNGVGRRVDCQFATRDLEKLASESFVYDDVKFSKHAPLVVSYGDN